MLKIHRKLYFYAFMKQSTANSFRQAFEIQKCVLLLWGFKDFRLPFCSFVRFIEVKSTVANINLL